MKPLHVLLDLDGLYLMGFSGKEAVQKDIADLHACFARFEDMLRITIITARPAAEVRPLIHLLPRTREEIHLTELGMVAYVAKRDKLVIHPAQQKFVSTCRAELIEKLGREFTLSYFDPMHGQFLPGRVALISLTPPIGISQTRYAELVNSFLESNGWMDMIARGGETVDILPKGWTKADALEWLETLYAKSGRPIDWSSAVWLADRQSDSSTADYVRFHGGRCACPANGDETYKEKVHELDGNVSGGNYHRGLAQALIWALEA